MYIHYEKTKIVSLNFSVSSNLAANKKIEAVYCVTVYVTSRQQVMVPILFSDLNSLCFPCAFPVMFIFFPEQTGEG